jgi:hypothetical protein
MGWLFATALMIGLGLGPVIANVASVQDSALTQAFAGTAATVMGAGALGFALSKDLALPAQARDGERHDLACDGHLRLDREHLPIAAEHLLLQVR